MTLNEKIVDSVSKTTGIRCFEGMPPDGIVGRFAYFFPLRSGTAQRYNEVAIFFMERPVFTPLSPEKATNDCRYLALNWLNGLYAYSGLKFQDILSQNNTRDDFGGYGVGLRLVLVDEARHTGGSTPVVKKNYFRMTADGTSAVVGWIGTYPDLEYRKEGDEWTDFTQNVTFYTWIEFRLKEGSTWSPTSNSNHFNITATGDAGAVLSGNIMSLVDPTLETTSLSTTYCFRSLFRECTGIVSAENLELADNTWGYCYAGMFYGCTALETAPSLPSTSAASHCYNGMFTGCTALVNTPELPATTLAQACYANMFYGCTALETAPKLPATTLAQNCYASMFAECSSLETAPSLPATTLADGCYSYMFRACTSLETSPELPATTLLLNCYNSMFIGCTSLEHIKVNFTEWVSTATDYWVENVAASGTFECPDGLSIVYDKDHIPTGWRVVKPTMYNVLAVSGDQTMGSVSGGGSYAVGDTVTLTATPVEGYEFTGWTVNGVTVSTDNPYTFTVSQAVLLQGEFEEVQLNYLTFTALQDNSSVGWEGTYPNLEYSTDGSTWTAFTEPVSVNTGGKVMFRNNGTAWVATNLTRHFTTTGSFNLSGELLTLKNQNGEASIAANDFYALFKDCGIVDASGFELPSTTNVGCYASMFEGCTQLTTAPVLPALSPAPQSYESMFYGCSSLNYIDARFTTKPSNVRYASFTFNWVYGVSATGTFVKNLDATWVDVGTYAVPSGWTVYCPLTFTAEEDGCTVQLTKSNTSAPNVSLSYSFDGVNWSAYTVGDTITLTNMGDFVQFKGTNTRLATNNANYNYFTMNGTISAAGDTTSLLNGSGGEYTINGSTSQFVFAFLFNNCTSLTKAPNLPSTTLAANCYYGTFYGCTNLVTAPVLPATTLQSYCYFRTFYGCSSLVNAPELPSTTLVTGCYNEMFRSCSSLNYIKCLATNPSGSYCGNWVNGVATSGTFVKASTASWTSGASGYPTNWTIQNA